MQLRNQLLLILRPRLSGLEQLGHVIPNRRPPLRYLRRMHRILSRQLRDRLKPNQGFESNFGLEGRTMPFASCFHSLLSFLQQTGQKSILIGGPVFGDHLTKTVLVLYF